MLGPLVFPFRGNCLWEMQIGPLVIQWGHTSPWNRNGILGSPLRLWIDKAWRDWMM